MAYAFDDDAPARRGHRELGDYVLDPVTEKPSLFVHGEVAYEFDAAGMPTSVSRLRRLRWTLWRFWHQGR
jgi:hypothetical protein